MKRKMKEQLEQFVQRHMGQGKRAVVPARLQAALALLEKLRDLPSLTLEDHLARKGSSGLKSHETFGDRAHARLGIAAINVNHGRRSSSLRDWGQELLDMVAGGGFAKLNGQAQQNAIDEMQGVFAAPLRSMLEQEPLSVHVRNRSAESVIRDVLKQAEEKRKTGDVAEYLVRAKLFLRFNLETPVYPANKSDRKARGDPDARLGDIELATTVFEIAVGLPDEKHLKQIDNALESPDIEVWLLTRFDRVATWTNELAEYLETADVRRVIVTSVESFVGQNISELAKFSSSEKTAKLKELFHVYNTKWIDEVGTPGIRVSVKQ
ncbi:MAG TPA: DUF4928 family protein [Gemmataceae bacterium]|nr:DUF4928 family protein [Gemmataceae bacterium]